MEALLIEFAKVAAGVDGLADEMLEDPRCHLVVLGGDEEGGVLFTIWDSETVAEVADNVGDYSPVRIRRWPVRER